MEQINIIDNEISKITNKTIITSIIIVVLLIIVSIIIALLMEWDVNWWCE